MNTLEHIGIQTWKLRDACQEGIAPIADQAIVADIEQAVTIDSVESAAAIAPAVAAQEDIVAAKAMIEPEAAFTDENKSTQSNRTDVGSLGNADWQELADILVGGSFCQSCARTNPVLGDGNLQARWVFVFDAPSAKDVSHQQLLSGRVGQLFDAILDAVDLSRESIYLTSVFKCPPSQDLSLAAQCGDLVHRQLQLIQPEVVIALGEFASQTVLRANENLIQLRSDGLRNINDGTLVAATYSLSEMLESPELKASVWQDLKKCLALS